MGRLTPYSPVSWLVMAQRLMSISLAFLWSVVTRPVTPSNNIHSKGPVRPCDLSSLIKIWHAFNSSGGAWRNKSQVMSPSLFTSLVFFRRWRCFILMLRKARHHFFADPKPTAHDDSRFARGDALARVITRMLRNEHLSGFGFQDKSSVKSFRRGMWPSKCKTWPFPWKHKMSKNTLNYGKRPWWYECSQWQPRHSLNIIEAVTWIITL